MILPQVRVARCAPKTHPCPHCGRHGRRKRRLHRRIRSLAYRQEAWLDVHYAEYQARCSCCKFFRSWPLDVPAKADYDGLVRTAVLDRILEDGLNVERTRAALQRDFFLTVSEGFVYDCLRWRLGQHGHPVFRAGREDWAGTVKGRSLWVLAIDLPEDEAIAARMKRSGRSWRCVERSAVGTGPGANVPRAWLSRWVSEADGERGGRLP